MLRTSLSLYQQPIIAVVLSPGEGSDVVPFASNHTFLQLGEVKAVVAILIIEHS